MRRLDPAPIDPTRRVLVVAEGVALATAATAGVPMFQRQPPVHSVLLGTCRLAVHGSIATQTTVALPANVPHRIVAYNVPFAGVAYLDPRRFDANDAERLARAWRGFIPGRDDLREALGDAVALPRKRLDRRVRCALDRLEAGASVEQAAAHVDLSPSRLTHLTTETLGAPPRVWGAWFKLQRGIDAAVRGHNLTRAAHEAGFADSAHLTRTCKRFLGIRPGGMMPQSRHLLTDDGRVETPGY